ncbi:helix-turn-helix domain-containing protein [Cryptosporangium japonicum]|uniref:PucR C-terminal helix-turn-helix domain-containing protein n=1 Tax=Cryptosporangium japonicum TaxID=80872 RepID=A0ABN0U7B6_9ACTN
MRAFLDAAGNGPLAAAALHVHRTSLYYRLGRVHDLTGLDLADGATRLALHLGFAMLDVLEARLRQSVHEES